ncbi:glycoside hydrolase family 76 protein [Gluconobacter kanchanaburiensis]|uniref:Glycosyl hydrolase n=1 Tax=Gluconobacter kanchanaburiensis NBRC 103587 TaxID=1307948 RepID=A0A511BA24_9PROT|nr:glycoside hydrolase family 76 protein [Gluconobacter kanchanaburiensis]GBR69126.1 hypothetical protein AA103587_1154 [Gluconobacter kanchanaburiensis NBRC 103587]GEK97260.1 hypothetical protein GKA01_24570 [Gluconobacter kanchanaburiensis NBRC 103587]
MIALLTLLASGTILSVRNACAQTSRKSHDAPTVNQQRAEKTLQTLMTRYGMPDGPDWRGLHAWQRFVTVSMLTDYEALSGNVLFRRTALRALQNRRGLDGNDDDLWVAQADLDMVRLTHNPSQAQDARAIFDTIASKYWDGHCGGGVWWDHARTYKNAITNELFLSTAARLYEATHDPAYKNWALKSWAWFRQSGMITSANLISDGLDSRCRNNGGPAYSYNQGVILDGLLEIVPLTNDGAPQQTALRIALAAIRAFTPAAGAFREPGGPMNTDARIFRGIFVRALGHIAATGIDAAACTEIAAWLSQQARSAWATRKAGTRISDTWSDRPFHPSVQAQITAASLFMADALTRSAETP